MEDIGELLTLKRVQLEMVSDRGYEISEEEQAIFGMDEEEFEAYLTQYRENPRQQLKSLMNNDYLNPNGDPLYVFYTSEITKRSKKKVKRIHTKLNQVTPYIALLANYSIPNSILIIKSPLSSVAFEAVQEVIMRGNIKHQTFLQSELMFNVTKHTFVPTHELIPKEEIPSLLARMKVNSSQIPLMLTSDPVAKYYGWEIGDIIRVHRDDYFVDLVSPKSLNYKIIIGSH